MARPLIVTSDAGLWCEAGGFHVDPWRPVERAVVTHAHGDHARPGMARYLCARRGVGLLRRRVGADAAIDGLDWGERVTLGDCVVSLHPAGHVLGSAQVRIECRGEVWVISGDYKRDADPSCEPFEPVRCDTFVTEATFALPIYRWEPGAAVAAEIEAWWRRNREHGRASVLYGYALGKVQRILAELARLTDRPAWVHGAIAPLIEAYADEGVTLLATRAVSSAPRGHRWAGELVLAPPSARGGTWARRFGERDEAFASGWMRVRGMRRRRGYDRGFVISDHADWPALLRTIEDSGASCVLTTHGYGDALVRVLRDRGLRASSLATPFGEEEQEPETPAAPGVEGAP
jgi:putative mRNA 3-end processing factor